MTQFKVGDRVCVYGYADGLSKAIVEAVHYDDQEPSIDVCFDGENFVTVGVHPKCCRRLIKKERRLFIEFRIGTSEHGLISPHRFNPVDGFELVEFVEVRKRK